MAGEMSGGQKIGGVYIDVGVKGADQATASLKEVGAATEEVGAKATQAGAETEKSFLKADGPIKEFGKSIRGAIGSITSLVGSIGAAIGVATTLYQIGKSIGTALMESADAAERLKLILGTSAADAPENLKKVREEIQNLEALAGTLSAVHDDASYTAKKSTDEQLAKLRELEKQYLRMINMPDLLAKQKRMQAEADVKNNENEKIFQQRKEAWANSQKTFEDQEREAGIAYREAIEESSRVVSEMETARMDNARKHNEDTAKFMQDMIGWTEKLKKMNEESEKAAAGYREEQEKAADAIKRQEQAFIRMQRMANAQTGENTGSSESVSALVRSIDRIEQKINGGNV